MSSAPVPLRRRLAAEFPGSAFLAAVVIGSGIAAQRLSPGQTGLELLEDSAATAAGLFTMILMFGPVSGGHFNPVVSFTGAAFGGLSFRDAAAYLPVQVAGCIAGAVLANLMFALPAISISGKRRATPAHFLSEVIATLGLRLVIFALARSGRSRSAPAAVGAQILGGVAAIGVIKVLYPAIIPDQAAGIIVHYDSDTTREPTRAAHDRGRRTGRLARPGPVDQATEGNVSCTWS